MVDGSAIKNLGGTNLNFVDENGVLKLQQVR